MEQKTYLNLLTNEQRKFFGLSEIDPNWKTYDVQSENFSGYNVTIYLDGQKAKKCIIYGEKRYKEFNLDETLSKNLDLILPHDENKKPSTIDSIVNKTAIGMVLNFDAPNTSIYNETTHQSYYSNFFDSESRTSNIEEFRAWVQDWCKNSSESDVQEITEFAGRTKQVAISYNEGDVFRVKLARHKFGYGRILLDYNKMKRNNEPFWDCLMGTPIVVSLYHILTEDKNVTIDKLKTLSSFPSEIIMDNNIRSGEYEIIGNIPVEYSKEDYPIMYGSSIDEKNTVYFQRGKLFLKKENAELISRNFRNNGVTFNLGINTSLMEKCIEENSNLSYYKEGPLSTRADLRNPINKIVLEQILAQFNLN